MRATDLHRRLAAADPAATTAADLAVLDDRARADLAAVLMAPPTTGTLAAPARAARPARQVRRPTAVLAAAAAVAVVVAGGTALVRATGTTPPITVAESSADPDAVLRAFGGGASGALVQAYTSPAELAADSDLVAVGRLERTQAGRTTAFDDVDSTIGSGVMVLSDVQLAQGELPEGSDGLLYVEVPYWLGGLTPEDAAAVPAGTPVLVYTRLAREGAPSEEFDDYIVDPDAGRPAGQPLYTVIGPQGLAVQATQDGGDVVVWPTWGGDSIRPGTLEQALPDGDLIIGS